MFSLPSCHIPKTCTWGSLHLQLAIVSSVNGCWCKMSLATSLRRPPPRSQSQLASSRGHLDQLKKMEGRSFYILGLILCILYISDQTRSTKKNSHAHQKPLIFIKKDTLIKILKKTLTSTKNFSFTQKRTFHWPPKLSHSHTHTKITQILTSHANIKVSHTKKKM